MASLLNMSGGSLLGKGLPYDAEIDYLESRNGAYIDTLIERNTNYAVDCTFRLVNKGDKIITPFGFWTVSAALRIFYRPSNNMLVIQYKTGSTNTNITVTDDWYKVLIGNNKVEINGIIFNGVPANDYTDSKHFFCFTSSNNANGETGYGTDNVTFVDIAHISISLNNIVLRDFIPVRVGTTGYMYDKVSGQLFGNAGTGDFILGPDKTN